MRETDSATKTSKMLGRGERNWKVQVDNFYMIFNEKVARPSCLAGPTLGEHQAVFECVEGPFLGKMLDFYQDRCRGPKSNKMLAFY